MVEESVTIVQEVSFCFLITFDCFINLESAIFILSTFLFLLFLIFIYLNLLSFIYITIIIIIIIIFPG